MSDNSPSDRSNGYEDSAERFMVSRDARIGAAEVSDWARALPAGSSILDLGCGHGVPISQALIKNGFAVHGVDASARMIAAFRERFPEAPAECAAVEHSEFLSRTFDGVVAWGLMFLLPAAFQPVLIGKVARALRHGGTFLFTSPCSAATWPDALTGRASVSLGSDAYARILRAEGLVLIGEKSDEDDNHYYSVLKA